MKNINPIPFSRWSVVFGALLIQASLGAIYIYSVFKPALKSHFPAWSATDLALPAQAVLGMFALSMFFSGRLQDRFGPKKTSLAGAALILIGMYIAAKAQTLWQFVFGFGVVGGAGIGAVYVCPIATCLKWFPDKRGLITGLAVAGFGAGGIIFAPLAGLLIARIGIMATIFYLGAIYFLAISIGAQFMVNPPSGWRPNGWQPVSGADNQQTKTEFTPKEMIKTRDFWLLWATYFIGCAAGLMTIMSIVSIWQSVAANTYSLTNGSLPAKDIADILAKGGFAVMAVSVLNSLGRIIWGRISDRAGREKTLAAIFIICAISLALIKISSNFYMFAAGVSLTGFCFGGFLALYPAITADRFGIKNLGANYGLMFTAYGAGGLLGPWLAPKLLGDTRAITYLAGDGDNTMTGVIETGNYGTALILAASFCLLAGAALAKSTNLWLKKK